MMSETNKDYVALSIVEPNGKAVGYMATSCKTCHFKVVEDGLQVGCRFGRIDKFRERGHEVSREEDGVHFEIANRFCNAIRSDKWAAEQPDPSFKALSKTVRAINRATFAAVVRHKTGGPIRKLYASLKSLARQKDYVVHVAVVLEDDERSAGPISRRLAEHGFKSWEVVNLLPISEEAEREYGGDPLLRGCDEALRHSRTLFYTGAQAGYEWPEDFFSRVDEAVNVEMDRIFAIGPDGDGNGFVAYRAFHLNPRVRGNIAEPIYQKAREASEVEGVSWYYRDHNEFFSPKDEHAAR